MKKPFLLATVVACILVAGDSGSLLAQHGRHQTQSAKSNKRKLPASKYPGQFPESSERLITDKDVEHQTEWGMKVMLNEIYARHGYMFREKDLRKHFATEKWYRGKERDLRKIRLTPMEIQNIAFIKRAQEHPKH